MSPTLPPRLAASPPEPSPRPSALYVRRNRADRRKIEGLPPAGCVERRVRPERRGIELTEFDFDERISLGVPPRNNFS